MLSNTFAYLPNGIIREIIAYTGVTYKKRNGKYMGQIPKDDPRYIMFLTIARITDHFMDSSYACSVLLTTKTRHTNDYSCYHYIKRYTITYNDSEYIVDQTIVTAYDHNNDKMYQRAYTYVDGDYNERIHRMENWLSFCKSFVICSSVAAGIMLYYYDK
jgi:hypothetical protein